MGPLQIDFVSRRRTSAVGWTLLLAGLAAASLAFSSHRETADRIAVLEATLQDIERSLPRAAGGSPNAHESRAQQASEAAARRIEDKLELPWGRLFATLESLATEDVALLALAPDPRKQQLRLSAEARSLDAMLGFHRSLEGSVELDDVALVSHEIVENAPGRPVRFDLTARWSIGRESQ